MLDWGWTTALCLNLIINSGVGVGVPNVVPCVFVIYFSYLVPAPVLNFSGAKL